MESKIEKIEGAYDIPILKDKLNRVIDYLNSQDQGGEKTVCEGCGKAIISRFMQSYSRDDGLHYYCLSCNPETEDTPEEKEEWKKRYVKRFGYWGEEIKFIKQLLEEREKEASEEVIRDLIKKIEDAHCDSISLELLKEIDLSKLKDNKWHGEERKRN